MTDNDPQNNNAAVDRWLSVTDLPPRSPLHPADEFPLKTISNPPSDSSCNSSVYGEELDTTGRTLYANGRDVAKLVHPPTPTMDGFPTGHTRRRSASLIANPNTLGKKVRKHRRTQSEHILEADEGSSSSEGETGSSEETDSTDFELDDMRSEEGLEDDEETGLTSRERRRRRRRKRRNTRLDQRVVEEVKISKEEEKVATQSMMRTMLINGVLIGLWYLFSISISLYNKWMFKQDQGEEKKNIFPYPLFTTCLHMIVQFLLSSLILFLMPSFRPRHDSINPHHSSGHTQQREEPADPKKPLMTKWFYFTRIGPCGAATGMDIGLGNMSLRFISLTFYTMCKSSALGFVLLFAFLFGLEKLSWKLVLIILTMTIGVVMMVAGETAFNALGFILVMSAACSSGFRWSLTQILLLRNPATSNPFSSIFFLAPIMFVSLFIIAVPVEGFHNLAQGLSDLTEARGTLLGIGILLFPGCLAFLMTASEFALLQRTSVVTLSICGIFKEVVTISAANVVFDDRLTPINLTGLLITILTIAAYNYIKIKKMREEARMEAHLGNEDYAPVLTADPDAPATSATGRNTRNMVRSSLHLAPSGAADRPAVDSPVRASPIKRPEDLE